MMTESRTSPRSVSALLNSLVAEYPDDIRPALIKDIPRIAYYLELSLSQSGRPGLGELEILDIGGGVGLFSVACAALGAKRSLLIDDFADADVSDGSANKYLEPHCRHGVQIIERDVLESRLEGIPGSFDVIASFDSIEHWHHSPKRLFADVFEKLKPGGRFVIGAPNPFNLRKRLTVPLGVGGWSTMQDWYDAPTFRGHVREPSVADLKYIARTMGLVDIQISGRNWQGKYSPSWGTRLATRVMDYPLRLTPSVCSDIYLVGTKPR